MATQVFARTNVTIAAAPPSYHLPNDAGDVMPVGLAAAQLLFDLGGSIPSGQRCFVAIEYQRTAWTDNAGVVHANGEWLQDCFIDTTTGQWQAKSIGQSWTSNGGRNPTLTSSVPHGLVVGETVTLSGFAPAAYNASWVVASIPTTTTFTITTNNIGALTTAGTISGLTTINSLDSAIGAVNSTGGMVEPYPTNVRLRVDVAGAWTLPSMTLLLTS